MSVRNEFAYMLSTDWAAIPALSGVRVIASEAFLDDVHTPTALIRMHNVDRMPTAPLSHRNYGMLVTLISGHTDLDQAADELDALVEAALDYFDSRYLHESATAMAYGDRFAFDIPVTVSAVKTAPEPTED